MYCSIVALFTLSALWICRVVFVPSALAEPCGEEDDSDVPAAAAVAPWWLVAREASDLALKSSSDRS